MRVGILGLGKLGLPVAVSMASKGHDVMGFDSNESRMSKYPQAYKEAGPDGFGDFNNALAHAENLCFARDLEELAQHSEILFVAVQTPHSPKYEGVDPLPEERMDFDYSYLIKASKELSKVVRKGTLVVIISTCLPGTVRKHVLPIFPEGVDVIYNPFFIAMGTVMRDFLRPEFVLIGTENRKSAERLVKFYQTVLERDCPYKIMSIESAELTKVAYNTFISFKIAYANILMEICHKIPEADVDDVTNALKCATDRLISPAYLSGGMGDGGGCHPRDNIAMSWLARELDLSFDLFEAVMKARENQARMLANMLVELSDSRKLPIAIYGMTFKPNTSICTGSHALLVANLLTEMGRDPEMLDPMIAPEWSLETPCVVLLGCNHRGSDKIEWPKGSVVIDPFRVVPKQKGVEVISLGKGEEKNG